MKLTVENYRQLPEDGKRYEILEGELAVTPAPGTVHQRVVGRLYSALAEFVRNRQIGELFLAPLDVILSVHTVVQPDLLFVSKERQSVIRADGIYGAPDLVVEVLSPSTAERDRGVKRRLYLRYGVREVWLVDPEARTLEVDNGASVVSLNGEVLVLPEFSILRGLALEAREVFEE